MVRPSGARNSGPRLGSTATRCLRGVLYLEPAHRSGRFSGWHPLPALAAAGVACSVSTDDPAMFATDLATDYAAAMKLGVTARDCYLAGQRGALCDARTKRELQQTGDAFDWARVSSGSRQ